MLKQRVIIYISLILSEFIILILFIYLVHKLQINQQKIVYQDVVRMGSKIFIIIVNLLAGISIGIGNLKYRFLLGTFCGLIFNMGMNVIGNIGNIALMNISFLIIFLLPIFVFELFAQYKIKKI